MLRTASDHRFLRFLSSLASRAVAAKLYALFYIVKALINIVAATETLNDLLSQQCSAGHLKFKEVVKSTFNCLQRTNLNG